jgi:hypothetical protein
MKTRKIILYDLKLCPKGVTLIEQFIKDDSGFKLNKENLNLLKRKYDSMEWDHINNSYWGHSDVVNWSYFLENVLSSICNSFLFEIGKWYSAKSLF